MIDIDEIGSSVIKSAYGLSMGSIWQHISVECADVPDNDLLRKKIFFCILFKLLDEKRIKLANRGVLWSGSIEQQIEAIQLAWPGNPSHDENDDLDDYGMWFLAKAPCGVVWLLPDGNEIWT